MDASVATNSIIRISAANVGFSSGDDFMPKSMRNTPENRLKAVEFAIEQGGILCYYWKDSAAAAEALNNDGRISLGTGGGWSICIDIEEVEE